MGFSLGKTINKVASGLRAIGLDARMVEFRPKGDTVPGWVLGKDEKCRGLIEVRNSPIRWVSVIEEVWGKGTQGERADYKNVYVVPDASVTTKGEYFAKSHRLKSVPLIGRVVGICWNGKLHGELIKRISDDAMLSRSLIEIKEDITIRSLPDQGCWSILSSRESTAVFPWVFFARPAPSRIQWDCYETIAHHLLGSSGK